MNDQWWNPSSASYSKPLSEELIGLVLALVARDIDTDLDALVIALQYDNGTVTLEHLGPDAPEEVEENEGLEDYTYRLRGEDFFVEVLVTRHTGSSETNYELDFVEGYEQARKWLLSPPPPERVGHR